MNWKPLHIPFEQHPKRDYITYLAKQVSLNPLLGYHLFLQGVNTPEKIYSFIFPTLTQCHNPFLLNEMKPAVTRILQAIQRNEQILIYGDYDCDGMTSSAILYRALRKLGAVVTVRLPIRSKGYGLSPEIIDQLSDNISLLITVDNGSSAHPAMKRAKERGIDVIVTDHHEVLRGRPDCIAFINPKRSDSTYPFSFLSGTGVVLKVVQALCREQNQDWVRESLDYIEYVTLGTIADMMPLVGENRIICWAGLYKMRVCPDPIFHFLRHLLQIKYIDSTVIKFSFAPLFNACGRIGDSNFAAKVLCSPCPRVTDLKELILMNEQRKQLTEDQLQLAHLMLKNQCTPNDSILVIHGEFHHGILGILANKLSQQYKKPAFVISQSGTGSARSVNGTGLSIIKTIQSCDMYLKKYGGHSAAAGFSLKADVELFRSALQQAARNHFTRIPTLSYLSEIPIYSFPTSLFDNLMALEPFGMGNPKPTFCTKQVYACWHSHFGNKQEHVQFRFSQNTAYAFSKGHIFHNWSRDKKMDVLYTSHNYETRDFFIRDCKIK